ncbi:MAG: ADP-ribosylglycohydrolase family protein [bacterium]|nr:ADP-ribosylglycohydrolase family protein [bacterium]
MLHRNDTLLLRIAQGDAYGAGFEYVDRANRAHWALHQVDRYVRHPTHHCCGVYTDDAQMSVAVAEVLLNGPPFTREAFADAFVRCFKRDPRDGYARGFQAFLESVRTGVEFLERIRPNSNKNGAAMRAVPIGVLTTADEVRAVAALQARITHDTLDGVFSAQAVALMSHFALWRRDPLSAIPDFVWSHLPGVDLRKRWQGEVRSSHATSVAMATTRAVADLVTHAQSTEEVLRRAIDFGGDTDSVAAIAVGIVSSRFHDPLPEFLERDLEHGSAYGVIFLRDLGHRLMERYATT